MFDPQLYNAIWDARIEMERVFSETRPDHPLLRELIRMQDILDNESCDDPIDSCTRFFD
jgi:hypothetical protein